MKELDIMYVVNVIRHEDSEIFDTKHFAVIWLATKLADNKLNKEISAKEIYTIFSESLIYKNNDEFVELAKPYFTDSH